MMSKEVDIVIVGAGAAGLMAGIWAGRTHPHRSILLLDGARRLGTKILASGGGRCNVTHDRIDAGAYAGSSRPTIQKVLRRFDLPQTVAFFRELGVELKREEGGKLFPTTDSSKTVLNALLTAARQAHLTIQHPRRVETVERTGEGFLVVGTWGQVRAGRLVLSTGGKSLPESGSDGHGYAIARSLGHSITPRIFPALVPLTLPRDHFLCALSGIAVPATLDLWSGSGKRLASFTDATLCAHFGLSGPSVLDISRYYLDARFDDPQARLTVNWLPGKTTEQLDRELQRLGPATPLGYLRTCLPERLARALCEQAGVEPGAPGHRLTRPQRKALAHAVTQLPLPITGHRGYRFAEATAGGVPLAELHLKTLESRLCPGLYCCGEVCDVDGRIGGFNFQWAWASGYTVGVSVGVFPR
ncbi:MAG: NAD(P)/FAD-dependent oxidoreductase [Candidatus Tectomicrobia bacterium]|uniref:NAD(P)/FAD-dependent oxidoreductase n=1 Tax=Tectimicrobiota bacterium TaxID=2528274 RepID=A0A932CRA4_UNCTE|nr:NAD(P)/FAD-dependent oxidoreductase [Candidatus Tectomicrobia bacterium]